MCDDLDNDTPTLQTINEKQEQLRKLKELAVKLAIFLVIESLKQNKERLGQKRV